MGVACQPLGVARWYNFPERKTKGKPYGRATWCRRRGTPATNLQLGVPVESQAWHAIIINQAKEDLGMPLEF
ncbi:hypothetical protein AHAS_Ahas20G0162200 [Arachis hypogaea]